MGEQGASHLNNAEGMISILYYLKKNKQFVSRMSAAVMYLQLVSSLCYPCKGLRIFWSLCSLLCLEKRVDTQPLRGGSKMSNTFGSFRQKI